MTAQEILERIMSAHWDMAACQCWICKAARELGYRPKTAYLDDRKYAVPPMEQRRD